MKGIDFTTFEIGEPLLQGCTHDCLYIGGDGEYKEGKVIADKDYLNLGNNIYETKVRLFVNDPECHFVMLI